MRSIVIQGPAQLAGKVAIQGAKNSAMKHVLIPLMTDAKFVLKNIPRIGSIDNLIEIIKLQGAEVSWVKANTLRISTEKVSRPKIISKELFYTTSGAIFCIPILTNRFGSCSIEIDPQRSDRGGDQIGSRTLDEIIKTLGAFGIETKRKSGGTIEFKKFSDSPSSFNVPVKSFSASVLALLCSITKKGKSIILNPSELAEFSDIVRFLTAAGAKIKASNDSLKVWGSHKLEGISYENMPDPHDFITFLSSALSTNSELTFDAIDYERMKLNCLEKVCHKMNIKIDFYKDSARVMPQLTKLKHADIYAGQYPMFITEWQVLFSPLFTQVSGESKIVETFFADRMQQWNEMKKMGARYKFFKDPRYPEVEGKPRAVKVIGPQNLRGAKVDARDVRTGAALVIAGLIAEGKTEISNIEHIERGYEKLVERLKKLGSDIQIKN